MEYHSDQSPSANRAGNAVTVAVPFPAMPAMFPLDSWKNWSALALMHECGNTTPFLLSYIGTWYNIFGDKRY